MTKSRALSWSPVLSDREFRRLAVLIERESGLRMALSRKVMVQSRLVRRLRELGLRSFEEYLSQVQGPDADGEEIVHLVDAVTTNKTEFFREASHFRILAERVLPDLVGEPRPRVRPVLRAWSAGCASGEEAYSLAMVLHEHANRREGFSYVVEATDINRQALRTAIRAVYPEEQVKKLPPDLRKKYLLRSRDRARRLVRVVPELRSKVVFRRWNLADRRHRFPHPLDIIFCRNVRIYFERPQQASLLQSLCEQLAVGGYLFLGHSETLGTTEAPLTAIAPMVYRKDRS